MILHFIYLKFFLCFDGYILLFLKCSYNYYYFFTEYHYDNDLFDYTACLLPMAGVYTPCMIKLENCFLVLSHNYVG